MYRLKLGLRVAKGAILLGKPSVDDGLLWGFQWLVLLFSSVIGNPYVDNLVDSNEVESKNQL